MNKMLAVFKREYLQTVRKKMFIIMTFLMPGLMALLIMVPATFVRRGLKEKTVVVIDGTGRLGTAFGEVAAPASRLPGSLSKLEEQSAPTNRIRTRYVDAAGVDPDKTAERYLRELRSGTSTDPVDGVLVIPGSVVDATDAKVKFYSLTVKHN